MDIQTIQTIKIWIGYIMLGIAVLITLGNIELTYKTNKEGKNHSPVFVVTTIFAISAIRFLGWSLLLIPVVLIIDFGTPFLADYLFRKIFKK
jgi:uncharacterized membrane protein SirB2